MANQIGGIKQKTCIHHHSSSTKSYIFVNSKIGEATVTALIQVNAELL